MKNFKIKVGFLIILTIATIAFMGITTLATNENIEIVKISDTDYSIYIKDYESTDFSFAFSNDSGVDISTLTYKTNASDGTNNIAYINSETISTFSGTTYMWAKTSGGDAILTRVEIDLTDYIEKTKLELTDDITKQIDVDSTKTSTKETTVDDMKKTETVGIVKILDSGDFEYQIKKTTDTTEYNNFNSLAERIAKFTSETTMYTKIKTYKEFYNLYTKLSSQLISSEWVTVENNTIQQPADAEDGEKYIVWINGNKITDVQFLTSTKEVSEEKITETITTKIPITYDNNTLLIVLGILIVAIIAVSIRIKMLSKKKEK